MDALVYCFHCMCHLLTSGGHVTGTITARELTQLEDRIAQRQNDMVANLMAAINFIRPAVPQPPVSQPPISQQPTQPQVVQQPIFQAGHHHRINVSGIVKMEHDISLRDFTSCNDATSVELILPHGTTSRASN